jgi:anaerobic magnesium-protoporphyrin IX monomethyl ester cyclase
VFRHVLCVYPYRRGLKGWRFCPPLGLECIGAVIEPHTEVLDIIDLRKERNRTIDFLRPETDLVCFSVNWDREVEFMREEINSVPPDISTILGGRHSTLDPEDWLVRCPNVNAVVRGDGEELIEDVCQGVPFEKIPGLSFRNGKEIFHNPKRRLGALSDHHFPSRNLRRYTYEVELENIGMGVEHDLVSASRGCPFNCTYCSFNRNPWGDKRNWTGRSPESIVEELAQIKAPLVSFTDDLFTYDMDRVGRICDLILARGIRKRYLINARLEIARRPDVLCKMERAGVAVILLGIESAHDKTLRSMRKGFSTAKIREYFEVLRNRAMIMHGYFIMGNIGESAEDMMQVAPFAHDLGVDTLSIALLRNEQYSGLDELVAQNQAYHIAPNGKIYSDHCSLKELKRLRQRIYKKFYTKRQGLRILNKAHRSGLLKVFYKHIFQLPAFFQALKRAWKIV